MAVTVDATKGAYIIPALAGSGYVPLTGGTMTGALTLPAGAVGTPSLMFTGAGATTGIYSVGSNDISFAVNGSRRGYFNTSTLWLAGALGLLDNTGGLRFGSASNDDPLLSRQGAAILQLATASSTAATTLWINTYSGGASNYERLTLTGVQGASVNITAETLGTGGDNLDIVLTPAGTGSVSLIGSVNKVANNSAIRTGNTDGTGNLYLDVSKLVLRRGNAGTFTSLIFTGATSGNVALVPGGAALSVRLGDDSGYGTLNSGINSVYEYQQYAEVTAPSAPSVNVVRVYAEDNGAGKTRLMALFATGAAQQLAIEP